MPPMPKDPRIRQRANRSATRASLPAEKRARRRAPQLPRREGGWNPLTHKWWSDVWHSPMATEYVQADLHGLYRLATLIDRFWETLSISLAAEIRLEQQAFGLTPLDRRRLEWSIAQTEEATSKRQQRQVRAAQAGDVDPRDVLKVVGE